MKRNNKNKPQIFIIHGGMTFKNRRDYLDFLHNREIKLEKKSRWAEGWLDSELGRRCEIIRPRMPLSDWAFYEDWRIHFERYIPLMRSNVVFIGSSLGAIFLAKYLSEHRFPKRILSAYLIAPPFDDDLPSEDLAGGFKLKSDLSLLSKNCPRLNLMFSEDDDIVPITHAGKYARRLPKANFFIFQNRNGHFKLSEFPEIVQAIKADLKSIKL